MYFSLPCWYLSQWYKPFQYYLKEITYHKIVVPSLKNLFCKDRTRKDIRFSIFLLNNNSSRALFQMKWQCCLLGMAFYCRILKYPMSHLRHLLKKTISSYCLMTKPLYLSLSKTASFKFTFLIKLSYYVHGP